jgi:hypothetical protein
MMDLDFGFQGGLDPANGNLGFDVDGEVSVSETWIRLGGDLLSRIIPARYRCGSPSRIGRTECFLP